MFNMVNDFYVALASIICRNQAKTNTSNSWIGVSDDERDV